MKHFTKIIPVFIAFVVALACFLPANVARASQGAVYFKPSSNRYLINNTFTVQVWVDVQQQSSIYHTSKGAITFPSSILQATKAVNATSGADFATSINQSQGRVNFNTMLWGNLSSGYQAHVFDITFKAKKAGSAKLGLASGTVFFDGPTSVRSSSYTIATPPCPSGQTGTWPNCRKPTPPKPKPTPTKPKPKPSTPRPSTPKPSAPRPSTPKPSTPRPSAPKPSTPKDESEVIPPESNAPLYEENSTNENSSNDDTSNTLSIGSVKSEANYTTANVSWLTNFNGESTFAYGTSKESLDISSEVKVVEQKSYATSLSDLKPGTLYYYQISTTSSGQYTTYAGQFQTKGYPVILTVTQGNQPLAGATVVFDSDSSTYTTSEDGSISLSLSEGDHAITIKTDSGEAKETVSVKAMPVTDGQDPDTQNITIATEIQSSSSGTSSSGAIAVGVILFIFLLLGAVGFIVFMKKRNAATSSQQVQTFDDSFWSAVPGASGVSEDIYGNPVYAPAEQAGQATGYPVDSTAQYTTPQYQSVDQYYADQTSVQNPENYGYATDANSYAYQENYTTPTAGYEQPQVSPYDTTPYGEQQPYPVANTQLYPPQENQYMTDQGATYASPDQTYQTPADPYAPLQ